MILKSTKNHDNFQKITDFRHNTTARLLANGNESSVLSYGMKRDFNAWLGTLGESVPVKTLTELREWNLAHELAGTLKYGQARLDGADELDLGGDRGK